MVLSTVGEGTCENPSARNSPLTPNPLRPTCRSCESTTMHAEVAGSSQPSSQDTQVQMTCALPMGSFGQWNTRPTVTSRTVKPPNVMLHVAKDMPQGMARSHWSLEDYELLQELHAGYASKVHKVRPAVIALCSGLGCCRLLPSLKLPADPSYSAHAFTVLLHNHG